MTKLQTSSKGDMGEGRRTAVPSAINTKKIPDHYQQLLLTVFQSVTTLPLQLHVFI